MIELLDRSVYQRDRLQISIPTGLVTYKYTDGAGYRPVYRRARLQRSIPTGPVTDQFTDGPAKLVWLKVLGDSYGLQFLCFFVFITSHRKDDIHADQFQVFIIDTKPWKLVHIPHMTLGRKFSR